MNLDAAFTEYWLGDTEGQAAKVHWILGFKRAVV